MSPTIEGLHHLTAISKDAQQTVDFYVGLLGLRFVKKTVNFDDPTTYHLYFADAAGSPGTVLTFFPWPSAAPGRLGVGQTSAVAFSVPMGALRFWEKRLKSRDVSIAHRSERFGEAFMAFKDPDGMCLELVETTQTQAGYRPWKDGLNEDVAIRGFHTVTLLTEGYEHSVKLLTEVFGFEQTHIAGERYRFVTAGTQVPALDLLCCPDRQRGRIGAGSVHHVAWHLDDDDDHQILQRELADRGFNVTPVIDRQYFSSIYFREPGGVLFEVATKSPGFTVDEDEEMLGHKLQLPPQHRHLREKLEQRLPRLTAPSVDK
ncbi:MAG: ring-cleaving dioxygenase [Bradymonadaceae bacterium]